MGFPSRCGRATVDGHRAVSVTHTEGIVNNFDNNQPLAIAAAARAEPVGTRRHDVLEISREGIIQ